MCLFYYDLNDEIKTFYKKNKIKIVSNGIREDLKFLNRLYFNLVTHKNVVVTELGSTLFYSMLLKKNTFLRTKYDNKYLGKLYQTEFIPYQYKKYLKKNKFLLSKKINLKKGFELAKLELGYDYLKKPEELKKILDLENIFKNITKYILSFFLKFRSFE